MIHISKELHVNSGISGLNLTKCLFDDVEITTLNRFISLTTSRCTNSHEIGGISDQVLANIYNCIFRENQDVISCIHSVNKILGVDSSRDVLERTILIFDRTSSEMSNLAKLYNDLGVVLDYTRQAIEGNFYRLSEVNLSLNVSEYDIVALSILKFAQDILENRITKFNNPNILNYFESLKKLFSDKWESHVVTRLQKYARSLLENQNAKPPSSPQSPLE